MRMSDRLYIWDPFPKSCKCIRMMGIGPKIESIYRWDPLRYGTLYRGKGRLIMSECIYICSGVCIWDPIYINCTMSRMDSSPSPRDMGPAQNSTYPPGPWGRSLYIVVRTYINTKGSMKIVLDNVCASRYLHIRKEPHMYRLGRFSKARGLEAEYARRRAIIRSFNRTHVVFWALWGKRQPMPAHAHILNLA